VDNAKGLSTKVKESHMLQVQQLHQYYGGSHILRGLSFDARIGEVTCLPGRHGVGQTTLDRKSVV